MPIYRTIKDSNYSVISNNTYLKDKDLSFGAIGLMTLLLSCKDDTNFSLKFISIISGKSIKIVTKYLNELKKMYYVYIKKDNSKDGYIYVYFIYENKSFNPFYSNISPDTQNPNWESPPMEMSIANKYYNKQDKIDKNKLNLCFLTEYLIDWNFINLNDINLIGFDDFLNEFITNYSNNYKLVIKVVRYVVQNIKKNKYLDEDGNEITNLLTYFISACKNNIECFINNQNSDLYDFEDIY